MLTEKIDNDLRQALKNRDAARVSTLRFLKAALQNAGIEKRGELKDEDVISVIKKQVKQRKESIEEFKKGNRADLVEKETKELEILQGYLPAEINPKELAAIIKAVIAETNALSLKDMGKVIKEVMAKTRGSADGKAVSAMVKEELSKGADAADRK